MADRVFTGPISVFRQGGPPPPPPGPNDPLPPHAGIAQPILLLADSHLLFWVRRGELFLERLRERIEREHPRAAYLGASNGDHPDYYALFAGAMEGVGITRCRHVPALPTGKDLAFLEEADLIVLAGGDVARGWASFVETGVRDVLLRRYFEGAVLVGVSAGAVQLGLAGWPGEGADAAPSQSFPTLGLVPYVISAHDEATDWATLRTHVEGRAGAVRGLGIPAGGGVLYHPHHVIEAVRHPACELAWEEGRVSTALLFPPPEG